MKSARASLVGASIVAALVGSPTLAQDSQTRKEIRRDDLSGASGIEVITSITEVKPGEELPRHSHHGIETIYVIQGALIAVPGKDPIMLQTGGSSTTLRDVPHAGFKVVGDQPLRLYTVHIVDKGKPLYQWVK